MEYIPDKDFLGKWGFVNEKGRCVINYLYDSVEPFENGYAKAMLGDRIIYLDKHGGWHDSPTPLHEEDENEQPAHRSALDILMDGFSKASEALHKGLKDCDS